MLRRIYSPFPLRRQTSLRKPLIIRAAQATDYRQSKALKKQRNKTSRQLFETKKIAEAVGVDRWVDRGTCPFTCWIGGDNMFAPTFLWLWRNGCVTLFGANGVLSLHLTLWQLIIKIQKKICDQNNCYWGKIFDEMARTVCIEHEMSSASGWLDPHTLPPSTIAMAEAGEYTWATMRRGYEPLNWHALGGNVLRGDN